VLAVQAESPSEKSKPGGLGLYLIRNAMDEVCHRAVEGGNELTMIKRGVVGL